LLFFITINIVSLESALSLRDEELIIAILNQKAPSTPLQGCGALISSLTRLLNHSVKIGYIPIYIGIEWDFILCELMIWRIISYHNNLRRKY